jgi:hypothetical protein|tara:strand:- start:789 stop:992 length:204 start_codon:yes stop_codon:yes gene_type:complete
MMQSISISEVRPYNVCEKELSGKCNKILNYFVRKYSKLKAYNCKLKIYPMDHRVIKPEAGLGVIARK